LWHLPLVVAFVVLGLPAVCAPGIPWCNGQYLRADVAPYVVLGLVQSGLLLCACLFAACVKAVFAWHACLDCPYHASVVGCFSSLLVHCQIASINKKLLYIRCRTQAALSYFRFVTFQMQHHLSFAMTCHETL
jgi:hypothetical protein